MAQGHTDAVTAFYAGLEDLLANASLAQTIHPALLQALPDLLVDEKTPPNPDCPSRSNMAMPASSSRSMPW